MSHVDEFAGAQRSRLEGLVASFEEAWRNGNRPVIDAFLPSDAADRSAVLTELVHADLEFRLKAGEQVRVEEYLARYPHLATKTEVLAGLLEREHDLRQRCDPALTLEDYRGRFPAHAEKLAEFFAQRTTDIDKSQTTKAPARSSPPQRASAIADGELGDRYRVLGEIARGGMGAVLRVVETKFDRPLAVKVMLPALPGHVNATERFLEEARVTGQLQHPGIPPVHEMGQLADGRPYFSMKLIEGRTLAQLLH
jgi:eukaryotic-like serine/threonine-protein kinase